MKPTIAIIGGTGLEDPEICSEKREISVPTTPWGDSATIYEAKILGTPVYVLARHGKFHDKTPTQVNYCANLWALKELGVTNVIATTACGSLREEIEPGHLVVLSDYIDMTKSRKHYSHYNNAIETGGPRGIMHMPSKPSFCPKMREILIESLEVAGVPHHNEAKTVTIEGPRFLTFAESELYRDVFRAQIVNMTTVPEASIAREMALHYASVAMVTDYDCWGEEEEVSVDQVAEKMKIIEKRVAKMLPEAIKRIKEYDWTSERQDLINLARSSVMPGTEEAH